MKKLVNGVEVEMSEQEIGELKALQVEMPEVSEHEMKLRGFRAKRDSLLAQCDWTQMSDVKLAKAEADGWKSYRQALRDLTNGVNEETKLEEIVFPITPK